MGECWDVPKYVIDEHESGRSVGRLQRICRGGYRWVVGVTTVSEDSHDGSVSMMMIMVLEMLQVLLG
ncbi:hypothetical protein LR48_Vigan07g163900 [Vigna angularis]|uniref:Uncharacterized protein n=1 Tax=Phaseolus angularis TaxID=3914 RepID=A0A0L9UYK5_PHAAN|nr:hypothetical protein LR48_Vigan07g163900 [Vigna angularis]